MTGRRHPHGRRTGPPPACAVITVSDTRTPDTDEGGRLLAELLAGRGYPVVLRRWVPDDLYAIRGAVLEALARPEVRAVLLTGGTGIAPRDVTVEAVRPLLDAELPGFGELFRWLSYQEIGPAAMLSRALAGRAAGVFVACLPGSPAGVRLAAERLILPELDHIAALLEPGEPAAADPGGSPPSDASEERELP